MQNKIDFTLPTRTRTAPARLVERVGKRFLFQAKNKLFLVDEFGNDENGKNQIRQDHWRTSYGISVVNQLIKGQRVWIFQSMRNQKVSSGIYLGTGRKGCIVYRDDEDGKDKNAVHWAVWKSAEDLRADMLNAVNSLTARINENAKKEGRAKN